MVMESGRVIRQGARIIDLAPTILGLMGVPVPEDIDGRILKMLYHALNPLQSQSKGG